MAIKIKMSKETYQVSKKITNPKKTIKKHEKQEIELRLTSFKENNKVK
jgi:hypothetical protein